MLDRGLRVRLRTNANGGELTLKVANQDCRVLPAMRCRRAKEVRVRRARRGRSGAVSLSRAPSDATANARPPRGPHRDRRCWARRRCYLRDTLHAWPLPPGLRPLGYRQAPLRPRQALRRRSEHAPGRRAIHRISVKGPLDRVAGGAGARAAIWRAQASRSAQNQEAGGGEAEAAREMRVRPFSRRAPFAARRVRVDPHFRAQLNPTLNSGRRGPAAPRRGTARRASERPPAGASRSAAGSRGRPPSCASAARTYSATS